MHNKLISRQPLKTRQRGISLILVLFILVVVSLLVASMAQLNRGGSNAVSQEILSVRALQAAESGAQTMALKIFPLNYIKPATCAPVSCPTAVNRVFNVAGLNGCTVAATCTTATCIPVSGAANSAVNKIVFTVTSAGTCNAGTQSAYREVQIGLRAP